MFLIPSGMLQRTYPMKGCKMKRTCTKTASAIAILFTMGISAFDAQAARVDARKLSCDQAKSLVQERGSVVMTFTATTYDKIVKNRWFCDIGDDTKSFFTPTADNPRCLVGKKCIPRYRSGIGR